MGFISYWLESLDYDYRVLSHCSLYQSPHSSCTKCIDSCLGNAIQIKNGVPVIDSVKCTQCGDCVASCPVQAVEGFLPKRSIINKQFIIDPQSIPTIKELLIYYKKGVTTLVCDARELTPSWKSILTDTNKILVKLGELPFEINNKQELSEDDNVMTRRELLFSWEKDMKEIIKELAPAKWRFNHEALNLSTYYSDYQFVNISLDIEKCTLCKACEVLCKNNCLQISDIAFSLLTQSCSNCSLCQDICPENAITLKQVISRATPVNHQIYSQTCSECHEPFSTLNESQNICVGCKKKKDLLSIK